MEKQSLYSIKRGFSIKRPATNKFIKKKKKKKNSIAGVSSVTFAKCFGPDIYRLFANC